MLQIAETRTKNGVKLNRRYKVVMLFEKKKKLKNFVDKKTVGSF